MTVYRDNGLVEFIDLGGKKATLEQVQLQVGGMIEAVPGTNGLVYCDEEGLLRGKPFNILASARFGLILLGNVVVLDTAEWN